MRPKTAVYQLCMSAFIRQTISRRVTISRCWDDQVLPPLALPRPLRPFMAIFISIQAVVLGISSCCKSLYHDHSAFKVFVEFYQTKEIQQDNSECIVTQLIFLTLLSPPIFNDLFFKNRKKIVWIQVNKFVHTVIFNRNIEIYKLRFKQF